MAVHHSPHAPERLDRPLASRVEVHPGPAHPNGNYIRSQGLAVRRQVDVSDDVVSLGRLLDHIAKFPTVLSRERCLAELHPTTANMGNEFFDSLVGPGAKTIDPTIPLDHLKQLRDGTAKVRKWVSNEVAHYNKNTGEFSQGLTFGDVHDAMDTSSSRSSTTTIRLILGSTTAGIMDMPPWEAVFRVAWIADDETYRHVALTQQETDNRRM